MARITLLFWSGVEGRSFKAPRLREILRALSDGGLSYAFYGIDKTTAHDGGIHLFRPPMLANQLIRRIAGPLGAASAGRHFGGRWLEKLAFRHGACGADTRVLFTQPFFPGAVERARKMGIKVVIEADMAHPLWAWDRLREAEQAAGVPRYAADPYNYRPYVDDAARAIGMADLVIAFSSFARDTFIESGVDAAKVVILRPPVPLDTSAQVDLPSFPRFVSTGNHGIRKGSHLLLEAWRLFRADFDGKSELVLIGDPTRSGSFLRKSYPEDGTTWIGFAPVPDVYGAFPGCFVHPSLMEGRPRAVLEAMSCGMPAIVSEAASCDIISEGRNGWRVELDARAIADRMLSVARDWQNIRQFGDLARHTALTEGRGDYADAVHETLARWS